jgi:cobalt transporter subunit CbtA
MQKILLTALVAGVIAGLSTFALQTVKLTPLILQAEVYEEAAEKNEEEHSHAVNKAEHHHDAASWEPANGLERNAYRLLADIGMGVGFALMLVGAFSLREEKIDAKTGMLWGLAGFATFSLAPNFGLPPELPTTLAADLGDRQIWWIATALATAVGIYSIAFSKSNLLKILGVVVLALPHIIGAPHAPVGGIVPTELNAQFAASSLATMALFWIVLGATSGWFYGRKTNQPAAQ